MILKVTTNSKHFLIQKEVKQCQSPLFLTFLAISDSKIKVQGELHFRSHFSRQTGTRQHEMGMTRSIRDFIIASVIKLD